MINLLKKIKRKTPWIWILIEYINSFFINLLYGQKIRVATAEALTKCINSGYKFRQLEESDLKSLETMFTVQPKGFDQYFNPHKFDIQTLRRLYENDSFLMLGAFEEDKIIGYFFIRFFVNRSAFRGKMVDIGYQGRGIAKQMGNIMTRISLDAGFRVFGTINKENIGSLASSKAVNDIKVIKELPDNYIYVEYTYKHEN